MRALAAVLLLLTLALGAIGCAETERCPAASYFGSGGRCLPIPDASVVDAASQPPPGDAGPGE
jgi:hypothetical protein